MNKPALPFTHWRFPNTDKESQDLLFSRLGINPIMSQILLNRNIANPSDAKRFFSPSLNDLHNPFLMKDMQKGIDRVMRAFCNHEKVLIFGDYDADGITSVALLVKFIREIHDDVIYYIPDRINEGYGLNKAAINKIKSDEVHLIITVDCGISDYDEVSYANSLGLEVIILDHHEVPGRIPEAVAVINPNRGDCQFPFKHLAGVGVAFNFLIALRGRLRKDGFWRDKNYPNLKEYLDLVALGTIGDVVSLIDENRIFARFGLELITEGRRVGLKALKEISGIGNSTVDSNVASFKLIPRINAAGRIGSPEDAVSLLLTDDMGEAMEIARKLDAWNQERQKMEKVILNEILHTIETTTDHKKANSFIFASNKWHQGIIGIVASRLVERYNRPSILISIKDGIGKGSGRSAAGFNLIDGLKRCSSLLLSYGGHRYAAGISIAEDNLKEFSNRFDKTTGEVLTASDLTPQTIIDAQCNLGDINHDLISQLDMLAPFGNMNLEPVLCVRNVRVVSPTIVGNNHLRMSISGSGTTYSSIWFNKGHLIDTVAESMLDIAFTPLINHWNGTSNIQLKIRDMALVYSS